METTQVIDTRAQKGSPVANRGESEPSQSLGKSGKSEHSPTPSHTRNRTYSRTKEETLIHVSHSDLVLEAAKWLRGRGKCSVVLTELNTTGEAPDAIGWHGTHSTLIECKISRADFLADKQKPWRRHDCMGLGLARYFLAPVGLLTLQDLPAKWGLIELTACGIQTTRKSELFDEINHRHEVGLLLSALRRIGHSAPAGISIRCYTIESKNTASIGIEPDLSNFQRTH